VNTFPLVDEHVLETRMRNAIGDQFHDLADRAFPQYYAYRAPGSYADAAENVLGEMGEEVVSRQHVDGDRIEVLGFVFDVDEAHLPEGGLPDPLGGGDPEESDLSPASVSGHDGVPSAPTDGSTDQVVHRDLGDGEDAS
jgi:hypothetical protein